MSNDNVVDITTRAKSGGGPPPAFPSPKLPQFNYKFVVVNKLDPTKERTFVQRGHLIVTQINLALIDENSEILWSIPNDGSVIYFERIDEVDEHSESQMDLPLKEKFPSEDGE